MYKSKIQGAVITDTRLEYEGSIGIDALLIRAADILPNEQVQVLNFATGARFETYVIEEKAGSAKICLYGPAAHLGKAGQKLFIISYCLVEAEEADKIKPKVIYLDENNKIIQKVRKNG